MPALLKTLKNKKELISNEIYLLSAVTALLKVAETLPHFLSPYLMDCLLQVSHLTPADRMDSYRICPVQQLQEGNSDLVPLMQAFFWCLPSEDREALYTDILL